MLHADFQARCNSLSDIYQHLPTLYGQAVRYPEAVVLELGVRSGNSTAAFLAAAEKVDGTVWSVDIQEPRSRSNWHDTGFWNLIIGDDLSAEVQAATPAEVDVLFIDTSHAYDHTLSELRTYVPRVRSGGVVLCHDTELESPEGVGNRPPFPVAKALTAYCTESGLTWVNISGCHGLGVIEKE